MKNARNLKILLRKMLLLRLILLNLVVVVIFLIPKCPKILLKVSRIKMVSNLNLSKILKMLILVLLSSLQNLLIKTRRPIKLTVVLVRVMALKPALTAL